MKHLSASLLESLASLGVVVRSVKKFNLEDIAYVEHKQLGEFLKGTYHDSGITICFKDEQKFLHIHRYCDMHHLELTFVYSKSQNWPDNPDEWKDAVKYIGSDDRDSMKNLLKDFFDWFDEHKKEIID